ncbi:MAG: DUF2779 domain-containing protein [Nitrospirae bacterium]|nr:DUF2779 domain-containing protein [Nitrospirota bacterium]
MKSAGGRRSSFRAASKFLIALTTPHKIEATKSAIRKGRKTIYEASFEHEGVFVKVDILNKGKKGWNIYEVKNSTKLDDVYIKDTALQYYVLKGAGIKLDRAYVVLLNKAYIKKGALEIKKLFISEDVTDRVLGQQKFVGEQIPKLKAMLAAKMPDIPLGKYCEKPYLCDFKGHCWKDLPEYSVISLRGKGIDKYKLYESGIVHLADVPAESLNKDQRLQLEAFLKKKKIIDKKAIREFISTLWYPLYFLDFETFESPIPIYDKARPTHKIPFQYSLHYIKRKGGKVYHSEYLARPGTDHRKELLKKLLAEIPEKACVLAYKKSVEKSALNLLAEQFPRFRSAIEKITDNLRDLMVPFQNRAFYHYKMKGAYSIKAVLPVIDPTLSYSELEIANGNMAMVEYARMNSSKDPAEIEEIRRSLIKYCTLDTLAMVRLLDKLQTMSK